MSSLLIKDVVLDGARTDVLIAGGRISAIGSGAADAETVLECGGRKAILPAFYNTHTHSAMTVLRGFADDMELDTWLSEHIWPAEAQMTPRDIFVGTQVAILEMIRSGTVFCNDMYWDPVQTARAAADMGVRAAVGLFYISGPDGRQNPRTAAGNAELLEVAGDLPDRIQITAAPHAVYSVSPDLLREVGEEAREAGRRIHVHVSETAPEVEDCLSRTGRTPVEYLHELGLIVPGSVLAHCTHITDADRRLIAESEAVVAHLPTSNMKLCSGSFDFAAAEAAGLHLTLGTDGASSNNSLSMFGEMKLASLSAKRQSGSPVVGRDAAVLHMATAGGAHAFGLDGGAIAPGRLADVILIDLDHPSLVADHNLTSNLVYAADSSIVDTVICDGRILMADRTIPGEREILAEAREVSARIRSRAGR